MELILYDAYVSHWFCSRRHFHRSSHAHSIRRGGVIELAVLYGGIVLLLLGTLFTIYWIVTIDSRESEVK